MPGPSLYDLLDQAPPDARPTADAPSSLDAVQGRGPSRLSGLSMYSATRPSRDPADPDRCRASRQIVGRLGPVWVRCCSAKCSKTCKSLHARRYALANVAMFLRHPDFRPTHHLRATKPAGMTSREFLRKFGKVLERLGRRLKVRRMPYFKCIHWTQGSRPHVHVLLRLPTGVAVDRKDVLAALNATYKSSFNPTTDPDIDPEDVDHKFARRYYRRDDCGYYVSALWYDGGVAHYVTKYVPSDTDELPPEGYRGNHCQTSRDWWPSGTDTKSWWQTAKADWDAAPSLDRVDRRPDRARYPA